MDTFLEKGVHYKESLGEYGSGWGWDGTDTLALDQETIVLDKNNSNITYTSPIRYTDSGTKQSSCPEEIIQSSGEMLFSGSVMQGQVSCSPNTENAGNWYSWSASTAGGTADSATNPEKNSICPHGWQLTTNTANDPKSYNNLIVNTYNISTSNFKDEYVRYLPMSFIRSGTYYLGSLNDRGSNGDYWSAVAANSTDAYSLVFNSGGLSPQSYSYKYRGYSVRCVGR